MNTDVTPPDSFLNDNISELLNRDLVAEWADDWTGRTINDYRLESLAGYGSYGVVFKAKRSEPYEEIVAIKLMPFRTGTLKLTSQFQRECQTLADLSHPNIAAILNAGVTEDRVPYIVMPFIDGVPIDQWVASLKAESPDRHWNGIAELMIQLCSAIEYAHQQGVIHCDLKPDNVLVTATGQLFVTDLGLAVRLDQLDETVSRGSWSPGTVGYSAPEIVASRKSASKSVDVYSIGAILYKLLTGQTPHGHSGWLESLIATVQQPAVPVADRMPDVPQILASICDRCLHKDAENRYASAGELSNDLQLFLDGKQPVGAHKHQTDKSLPRRRTMFVVCGSLLLLVIAGFQWLQSDNGDDSSASGNSWSTTDVSGSNSEPRQLDSEAEAALIGQVNKIRENTILPASRSPQKPGDLPRQFETLKEATSKLEAILQQAPNNPTIRQRTGDAYHFTGLAASHTQNFAEADRAYLRCQELFDSLAIEFPKNVDYKFSQFSARLRRASICGPTLLRKQLHEECLEVIRKIVDLEPDNVDYMDAVAATYGDLAADYHYIESEFNLDMIEKMSLESRKWAQRTCSHPDAKPLHRKHLVNSAVGLFFVEDAREEYDKAATWLDEALVQCRQFEAEYPHPGHSELLFVTLCDYAVFARKVNQPDLAEQMLDEAESVLRKLRETVPEWTGVDDRQNQLESLRNQNPAR